MVYQSPNKTCNMFSKGHASIGGNYFNYSPNFHVIWSLSLTTKTTTILLDDVHRRVINKLHVHCTMHLRDASFLRQCKRMVTYIPNPSVFLRALRRFEVFVGFKSKLSHMRIFCLPQIMQRTEKLTYWKTTQVLALHCLQSSSDWVTKVIKCVSAVSANF